MCYTVLMNREEGDSMMIGLGAVKEKEKEHFWNIFQEHLYEMTSYYPDEMDGKGKYYYGYFEACFTDPERKAFLIPSDEKTVGFVMLNRYSAIGQHPDCSVAGFTLFPFHGGKHYATDTANQLFSNYHGRWELKYHEKTLGAKKNVDGCHCALSASNISGK